MTEWTSPRWQQLGTWNRCYLLTNCPYEVDTFRNYPADIRKVIYTTNAIESLNSAIRKAIKKRKLFPTDDATKKVIYLAIQNASKKWTMPIRNWKPALKRFMSEIEERLAYYI